MTRDNAGTSRPALLRAAMAARTPEDVEREAAERRVAADTARRRAVQQLQRIADGRDATLAEAAEAVGNMLNGFDVVKRDAILGELLAAYLAVRRGSVSARSVSPMELVVPPPGRERDA